MARNTGRKKGALVAMVANLPAQSSLLGPVDPSSRAFSRRFKFTVRRLQFNKILFESGPPSGRIAQLATWAMVPYDTYAECTTGGSLN